MEERGTNASSVQPLKASPPSRRQAPAEHPPEPAPRAAAVAVVDMPSLEHPVGGIQQEARTEEKQPVDRYRLQRVSLPRRDALSRHAATTVRVVPEQRPRGAEVVGFAREEVAVDLGRVARRHARRDHDIVSCRVADLERQGAGQVHRRVVACGARGLELFKRPGQIAFNYDLLRISRMLIQTNGD